jgi:hypothetical protein
VEDNIAFKTISGAVSSIVSTSETNACKTEEESDSNSLVVSWIMSSLNTILFSSDFESEEPWEGHDRHLIGF